MKTTPIRADDAATYDLAQRVRQNQAQLVRNLKNQYNFIVCGAGSSGSVVARRLAENSAVSVLLLEAGGNDELDAVTEPGQWPANLGSERDWGFQSAPDPNLNGRSLSLSAGKVLGGGSSINALVWSRGHKNDWDYFAAEANDPAWNYESVLKLYHRIEDWQGSPDPYYRGTGGPVSVSPGPNPSRLALAMLDEADSADIPRFANSSGRIMEGAGGCSTIELITKDGKRQSIFRSYTFPYMDRPNLTVLTGALVTRIRLEEKRATGVEVAYRGQTVHLTATDEVILSVGALQTPKLLMQSGIGDRAELERFGIPVVQHLPGVGQHLQDHATYSCIWEFVEPLVERPFLSQATFSWKSRPDIDTPDLSAVLGELPFTSPENTARFAPSPNCWTLVLSLFQPKSRGRVYLTGANPTDGLRIELNTLSHPDDMGAVLAGIARCRMLGNSAALRSYARQEIMPGNLEGPELENFLRDAAISDWHQTSTAKMGRDELSVVDNNLNVYGIDRLRIADASIMPRVIAGNTMAPCVVIGERAGDILKKQYNL